MTSAPQQSAAVHSRRATWYLLLGLAASFMPLPYNIVAAVPLLAAVYESVRTMREIRGAGLPRSITIWTGAGLALTIALLVSIVLPFTLYALGSNGYQSCLEGANTQVARQDCESRYR